jgi:hypothetical protein
MEFEYPQLIYLDTTSNDISLVPRDGASQDKYTRLDTGRGSSGVVYVNEESTKCIKLILYPQGISDDAKERQTHIYENEVRLQTISHSFRFAPAIYKNFRTKITINETEYDVYVIVMEYLNPDVWNNIAYNELTPIIMKDFVMATSLYNDVDPYSHFYRHITTGQIVMIDYGNVKECTLAKHNTLFDCFNRMLSRLHHVRKPPCNFGDDCIRHSKAREKTGELIGADHFKLFNHPIDFIPIDKRARSFPYGGSRNKQTNRKSRRRSSTRGRRYTKRTTRRTRRRRR